MPAEIDVFLAVGELALCVACHRALSLADEHLYLIAESIGLTMGQATRPDDGCTRIAIPGSAFTRRNTDRSVGGVEEISRIVTRLREAASLPDILAAGFDAFMSTADAAIDGRESITIAPALPQPRRAGAGVTVPDASATVEEIAGVLAGLGALLRDRLQRAGTIAATAGERTACTDAATFGLALWLFQWAPVRLVSSSARAAATTFARAALMAFRTCGR